MRRRFVLFLCILFIAAGLQGLAQEDEAETEVTGKHYPVNLSLYYPISINKTRHDRVNLNLSLIYSRVGAVKGIDISLIASAITNNLEGLQICGLAGVAGEEGTGIQLAGLAAVAGESFSGLQVSGLASVAGERLKGVQISGLFNVAGEKGGWLQAGGLANVAGEDYSGAQLGGIFNVTGQHLEGFQLGGLFNVAGETCRGLQAVGLFNVAGEYCEGAQIAGLFNVAGEELRGFQLGTFNIAGHSEGLQIGVVNVGGTSNGVQLGVVNYTKKENKGLPIGLINLADNGRIKGVMWGGSNVALSGGIKFEIGRIYSIVSLGAGNLDDKITGSLTYGWHYGLTFTTGRMTLSPDIGVRYRDNKSLFRASKNEPDQCILEGRLLLGIPLSERMSLLLGGGIAHAFDSGKCIDCGKTAPLFVAGIEFF